MRMLRSVPVALVLIATTAGADKARTTATIKPAPPPPFALNFDPGIFDKTSATINNKWWPLKPGTQMTWEGSAFEDGEKIRRKVVFTVTDLTKEIAGVRTLVGWDRDYQNDSLTESELIFLAQAKDGTVWHLGEYVEHYEDRPELKVKEHYDGSRLWLVGYLEGAKAGIYMPAAPRLGAPAYSQGFAPYPWDWDDWGKVHQVGQKTCVPVDCYSDVLVIREYEPVDPGVSQLKYYAPGVGTVRVGWLGEEDEERETLELVKLATLTPEALAEVRAAVLAHESRAYMYGLTPPAEPMIPSKNVSAQTKPVESDTLKNKPERTSATDSAHAPAQVRKISDEKAKEIAVKTVPGEAMNVELERKLGKHALVVEVIADEDGSETDVIIDMVTGEVLGTEK